MKLTNKWLLALLPAAMLSSCADDVFDSYKTPEPASLAETKYLDDYKVLKDYNSGIKLGAVVSASEYTSKGLVYGLTSSNFNEVAAGNSLMHGGLVKNSGNFDDGALEDFIKASQAAGHTVFGSALLSNTDNNTKYFKNILANKVDPNYEPQLVEMDGYEDTRCIRVPTAAKKSQGWDNQFWLVFEDTPANGGETWEYSMDVRADREATIGTQIHQSPSDYIFYVGIDNVPFTTEWTTITKSGTFSASSSWGDNSAKIIKSIAFNLSDCADANTYYFKNVSFKIDGKEVIVNGDLKSDETKSFVSKFDEGDCLPSEIVNGYHYKYLGDPNLTQTFSVEGPCLVVHATAKASQSWDNQFWIKFEDHPATGGESWEYTMKVRAINDASVATQAHEAPGSYVHHGTLGNINFTTDWETITAKGTFPSFDGKTVKSIAFNLNDYADENTYFFASISLKINGEEVVTNPDLSNPTDNKSFVNKEYPATDPSATPINQEGYSWTITKTPDKPLEDWEKHDTIRYALNNYITNVMATAKGNITSWDILANVVAEDGSGVREASESDATSFNWAEYLNGPKMDGSNPSEFVQLAFKYAREAFKANGGNEGDLKLFINENGLDKSAKLNGLTKLMTTWEQDKSVKFDGISTSITAVYSEDEATLTAEKKKVEDLLKALAKTGRLIRISGIDLSYKDASGAEVASTDVEQGKKMGTLYTFIVQKYKELIPANQQAGIFVSNLFDTGNKPNGLWNAAPKYSRKPQYGGFADGLQ